MSDGEGGPSVVKQTLSLAAAAYPQIELSTEEIQEIRFSTVEASGNCRLCKETTSGRIVEVCLTNEAFFRLSRENGNRPFSKYYRCEGCLGDQLVELGLRW